MSPVAKDGDVYPDRRISISASNLEVRDKLLVNTIYFYPIFMSIIVIGLFMCFSVKKKLNGSLISSNFGIPSISASVFVRGKKFAQAPVSSDWYVM